MRRGAVGPGARRRIAGRGLLAGSALLGWTVLLFLAASTSGCERGCIRLISLAAQQRAEDWLRPSQDAWELREDRGFDAEVGRLALQRMRAQKGSGRDPLQGLDTPALRAATFALLAAERDDNEDEYLAALLASPRLEPFRAEPSGLSILALAIDDEPIVLRLLMPLLERYPRTRPPDTVLCGLRTYVVGTPRDALLRFCPCVKDDD